MEQMKGRRKENKGREISVLGELDKYAVTGWREQKLKGSDKERRTFKRETEGRNG